MDEISFRVIVDPLHNGESAYHCDIRCTEADIQAVDKPHGGQDFIERYIKPAVYALLDQFQQPYTDIDDLMRKTQHGTQSLPRSVEFYRQKFEMSKTQRDARKF